MRCVAVSVSLCDTGLATFRSTQVSLNMALIQAASQHWSWAAGYPVFLDGFEIPERPTVWLSGYVNVHIHNMLFQSWVETYTNPVAVSVAPLHSGFVFSWPTELKQQLSVNNEWKYVPLQNSSWPPRVNISSAYEAYSFCMITGVSKHMSDRACIRRHSSI